MKHVLLVFILLMTDNVNNALIMNIQQEVLVHVLYVVLVIKLMEHKVVVWNVLMEHFLMILDLVYLVQMVNFQEEQEQHHVNYVVVVNNLT